MSRIKCSNLTTHELAINVLLIIMTKDNHFRWSGPSFTHSQWAVALPWSVRLHTSPHPHTKRLFAGITLRLRVSLFKIAGRCSYLLVRKSRSSLDISTLCYVRTVANWRPEQMANGAQLKLFSLQARPCVFNIQMYDYAAHGEKIFTIWEEGMEMMET